MQGEKIDILMATYNGGKYIETQILSLLQQKYKNWHLYIHDDGSADTTLSIIKKYTSFDSRITLIEDGIKNLGAGKNFLSLVKYSTSKLAIFCDQDDIWLENKLSEMVDHAFSTNIINSERPSIVYADGYSFSDKSGNIDFTNISQNHAKRVNDFLFFNGGYQGCSIMFNRSAADIIRNYKGYVHLHDDTVSLVAHALGDVYFLPKQLMLYRQHDAAVTGHKTFKRSIFHFIYSDVDYLLSRKHHEMKISFFKNYSHLLSAENYDTFEKYIKFAESKSKLSQLYYIIRGNFTIGGNMVKLIIKTLIRKKFSQ